MNTLNAENMKPRNIDPLTLEELYDLLQTFTNIYSGSCREYQERR